MPPEWAVQRFRFFFRESKERNGYSPVGNMLSVSEYHGVIPKKYEHEEQRRTNEELQTYRVVRPGQLTVNTMWLNHLALGVSDVIGHVSPAYAVYNISPLLDSRYVHHLLRSQFYLKVYLRYLYGIRPNSFQIKADDWNSIPVIVPPLDTQKTIADFLDRETDRIDRLVEKKQRLIELLAEKRQALITRAVTRGLDQDLTDKREDTRVIEGGGGVFEVSENVLKAYRDIPSDWNLRKLKFISDIRNSNVDKIISEEEEPVRLCNYTDVYYHERITPDLYFKQGSATKVEIRRFQLKSGQIIITKDSESWDDIGIPALVTENMPDVLCGYHLSIFDPYQELDGGFLTWLCRSEPLNGQFKLAANGVTRFGISQYAMKNAYIVLPPACTQKAIAEFLDRETGRIDRLIEKTQQSITLLSEFRSALITAAVTGQIDVKTWEKKGQTDLRMDQMEKEMED